MRGGVWREFTALLCKGIFCQLSNSDIINTPISIGSLPFPQSYIYNFDSRLERAKGKGPIIASIDQADVITDLNR